MRYGDSARAATLPHVGAWPRWLAAGNIQRFVLLFALVVVFLGMGALNPRFLTFGNMINIARQISINLIIAVGMTFCMITGGFDLSVGSVGIAAGSIGGLAIIAGGNVPLGLAVGLAVGAVAGLLNGCSITRLKVNPFVTTLGMMTIGRGVALLVTGGMVITGLPDTFNFLGVGFLLGIPLPIYLAAVVALLGHLVLAKTEFGLNVYAVGGNYQAARLAGLKNDRILVIVYTMQGFLAALGGLVLTARVVSIQPSLMHTTNLDVIAAVVVGGTSLAGGRGSIGGTILGTILMGALMNGLNIIGVGFEWQLVVIGVIIVMAVSLDTLTKR